MGIIGCLKSTTRVCQVTTVVVEPLQLIVSHSTRYIHTYSNSVVTCHRENDGVADEEHKAADSEVEGPGGAMAVIDTHSSVVTCHREKDSRPMQPAGVHPNPSWFRSTRVTPGQCILMTWTASVNREHASSRTAEAAE